MNKEIEIALNAEREAIAQALEQQAMDWYANSGSAFFQSYTLEHVYQLKADGLLGDRLVLALLEAAANVRARITEVD